ncbi:murein biosynthesis integral membrane protein MurJ [Jeotgalibacillus haloalkalitolerans]|uniref:Probable lipid II flippase MurJ n=1 Tax=Jeotgalibacillus haloalkalitolerans TaxID=3104292 RepID=A0ABU5KKP3_9BACL|nr:murein biosynthesis integral membrane protein MurJ [Jeotgalibacillus sp. HH7-29]MDZ5711316.1 murein biosynthesis integral membrane protein MurJ [Jeotgalibacillus sp. HH7-29]
MKKVAIYIVIITVFSRFLGFGRELTIAYYYGASYISDAYIVSLIIPTVIFGIIGTGVMSGIIPIYIRIMEEKNEDESKNFLSNVLYLFVIITSFLLILFYLFKEKILRVFAIGFDENTMALASNLAEITIFTIYFTVIISIFTGYLQLKDKFIIPALLGLIYNIVIITSIVLSYYVNVVMLGYGALIAAFLQMLFILYFAFKNGFSIKAKLNFYDKYIKALFIMCIPIMMSQSISQINVIVDKTIASTISEGAISAINYADRVNSLILSTVVMTISTLIYPRMSKFAINKDFKSLKNVITLTIRIITLILVPTTVFLLNYSEGITRLIFERGNFSSKDVNFTSKALLFYSLGMIFFAYREILTKILFSFQNSKIPLINSLIALFINIILTIYLARQFGISGIVLATSLSALISTIFLYWNVKKLYGEILENGEFLRFLKVLFISIFSIELLQIIKLENIIENTDFYIILTGGCYIFICALLLILVKEIEIKKISKVLVRDKTSNNK